VAALCAAQAANVVFTSGASEAAAMVLDPRLAPGGPQGARLLVFVGEHPCIRAGGRFAAGAIETLPARADGTLDLASLKTALERGQGRPTLIALQLANNETGAIQPVAEAAALVRAAGAALVCDAVQAAGRLPIDIAALGADWLILSCHKLGGPLGAGALVGRGPFPAAAALVRGGGQERGARAGTENAPAIAGFGAAAAEARAELADEPARLAALRDGLEARLKSQTPGLTIFSGEAPRLCNTSCFAVPGLAAGTLAMALDLAGVAVSAGAACSSGKLAASPLLAAMAGDPSLAAGALRVSLGRTTGAQEIDDFAVIFRNVVAGMLARRSKTAA
jgi:cysteine desulfurase